MPKIHFKTKIVLVFFSVYTLLSFYLVFNLYQKAVLAQKEALRTRLVQLASIAVQTIAPEKVLSIAPVRSSMEKPLYAELVGSLRRIMDVHYEISDVYLLVPGDKPGVMKFIANADPKSPVACGEEYATGTFPELTKAFRENKATADREVSQDKWGWWLSGYAPLREASGKQFGILGIDISAQTIDAMRKTVFYNAVFLFIIGTLLSVALGKIVSWWLTKPLNILLKGIKEIGAGNLDHKMGLKAGDEFGMLAESFDSMAHSLKRYIDALTKTTKEKERLKRDIEIAAEMQKAMLPHFKLDVDEIDLAGMSLPALQVGGDYFDYMNRDGRNIGFIIADAAGKGINSSLFMTNSKSILKVLTTQELSPSKVIRMTNDMVIKDVNDSAAMFVTLFYGIFDRENWAFRYCNAGHNPPIYYDRKLGTVSLLKAHGIPIGMLPGQEYAEDTINMSSGDMVVFYTDGVVEMMNSQKEMFGIEALIEIIITNHDFSSQQIADIIKTKAFAFAGSCLQFDDFTLLVFKLK
ncbi:MAG: SpoIIE family protein phosphatase [Candidatus Omnitrophica bacterium]|nr:SpoIIE family protein phosphatase [Candidatus Omnitrophota bacterium]